MYIIPGKISKWQPKITLSDKAIFSLILDMFRRVYVVCAALRHFNPATSCLDADFFSYLLGEGPHASVISWDGYYYEEKKDILK